MPRHPSPRQEQNRRPELPQAQGGPDHQPGRGSGRRAREEAAYSGGAGAAQRAAAAVAQQGGPPRGLRPPAARPPARRVGPRGCRRRGAGQLGLTHAGASLVNMSSNFSGWRRNKILTRDDEHFLSETRNVFRRFSDIYL